jgi:hypothetical protein
MASSKSDLEQSSLMLLVESGSDWKMVSVQKYAVSSMAISKAKPPALILIPHDLSNLVT